MRALRSSPHFNKTYAPQFYKLQSWGALFHLWVALILTTQRRRRGCLFTNEDLQQHVELTALPGNDVTLDKGFYVVFNISQQQAYLHRQKTMLRDS